eukprot:CAMPEP_0202728208 /NCGR_PEP_ID=MMETSP1385-20130828/185509_1 /ASSEMBLY_ACC=CAM_ASM_000861 /TAXON_ID=933848 /ORGANISM="Elphidium margaritaceum" /LENGTH=1594 /DNA_ID=CAMNT_0049394455 /DNA_START=27 /DNA_END=4812 /DNA_ORIENTATION=-
MKRTFDVFNSEKSDVAETKPRLIDLTLESSPKRCKRARLHSPPLLEKIRRDDDHDEPGEHEHEWWNNESITITGHELCNEWWQFKVVHPSDVKCSVWLRHAALQHLAVYHQYLARNELTLDEVAEAQYIPERILDHHYNEESGSVEFEIAWRGYSAEYNTWEPAKNLIDNALYLNYCKEHSLKPVESICSQLSQSSHHSAHTAVATLHDEHDYDEEEEEEEEEEDDDDDDDHDVDHVDEDGSGDCKSEDADVDSLIVQRHCDDGGAEQKIQKPSETEEEEDGDADVEVVIDVMREYELAQTQADLYSPERIDVILRAIEVETERLFNAFEHCAVTHDTHESLIVQMDRYFDVRSAFETLKNELLFQQYQHEQRLSSPVLPYTDDNHNHNNHHNSNNNNNHNHNNNNNHDGDDDTLESCAAITDDNHNHNNHHNSNNNNNHNHNNNNNHDGDDDNDDDDDDIVVVRDALVDMTEHAHAASNVGSPHRRRSTLLEYNFTPVQNANTETKTNLHPNALVHRMQAPKLYAVSADEDIQLENVQRSNFCYACRRKWNIANVELLRAFPLCPSCPAHVRIGYNRQLKEDWFCPYCIHSAQCVLFNTFERGNAYGWLRNVCDMQPTLYLYVKPNDSAYWKTYVAADVLDTNLGTLMVRGKKRKLDTVLTLSEIDAAHILWAFHDEIVCPKLTAKDMSKIDAINDDGTVCVCNKHTKERRTVPLRHVLHVATYFTKMCAQLIKWCRRHHVAFDKARMFRYARFVQSQKQKKRKFGYNAVVQESAPLNSRQFGGGDGEEEEAQDVAQYPSTEAQLLAHLNLTQIPAQYVGPPQRRLCLRDISRYALTLIVGESGCGKSTLLRQLHRENPTQTMFKSADQLQWNRDRSVISHFSDVSVDAAMKFMSSIGLNNVRTWLKPFHILSQGEQYRVTFARLLKESQCEPNKVVLIDEFSSVLDRTNARCMSLSIAKCIRAQASARFVLASANADIIRYLQPDLVILLGDDDDDGDGDADGDDDGMLRLENPNLYGSASDTHTQRRRSCLLDVKAVLDLPPFALKKADRVQANDVMSVNRCMTFDVPLSAAPLSVDREVRELQCQVAMDAHTTQTSTVLDVWDFQGVTVTHIPYLSARDIYINGARFFQIGVMLGPSGCGKTTSGERLFGRPCTIEWDNARSIASHFQGCASLVELFEVCALSLHLAFSRFEYLSEGEKHRVNIARCLQHAHDTSALDRVTLIDEFTSFLDRETAITISRRISDYIYRHGLRNIVFLACKYDVISTHNGLHPSWIFDVQNKKMYHYQPPSASNSTDDGDKSTTTKPMLFRKHSFLEIADLWNVPKIRLVLRPCLPSDFDPTFSKYHYMDANINPASNCYSVWAYFTYCSQPLPQPPSPPSSPEQKQPPQSIVNRSKLEMDADIDVDDDDDDDDENDANGTSVRVDDDAFYKEDELQLVGFTSMIHHYGRKSVGLRNGRRADYDFRETRTVILPSFQGIGFGSRIADCLGEYLALHGCRLHSKTGHPRYGGYRDKQPSLWMATADSGKTATRCLWDDIDRCVYEPNELEQSKKKFYIHVYKLKADAERDEVVEQKLQQRVIVTKQYKNLKN